MSSSNSSQLILIRHGESTYNALNQFTGAVDCPLTDQGRQQALHCAELLRTFNFGAVFCSQQQRAMHTCQIIRQHLQLDISPTSHHSDLNERNYGSLNGQNKQQAMHVYGSDQVQLWRRDFSACPPKGESLRTTAERAWRCFTTHIAPNLASGSTLVVAHGNSIRGLLFTLLKLSPQIICHVEVGWCEPWIITMHNGHPVRIDIILRESTGKQSKMPTHAVTLPVFTHEALSLDSAAMAF